MKPGDKVKIKCKDDENYSGILIDQKKDVVVIKLVNGYNMGIDKEKILDIELVEEGKDIKIEYYQKPHSDEKLPKISILHTGGTIASKVDYRTGAVYSSFNPEDLLGLFPELGEIANFDSRLISNMWSDDLRFKNFSIIAQAIEKEVKKGVEGIIVGMGTDNLAVCAAALSFIIENINIPVILVGSQRSSDRGSSDAAMNLISAARLIVNSDFSGVGICMHEHTDDKNCILLSPTKTKKMHSSRRDAFKPVNESAIATIEFETGKIKFITAYVKKNKTKEKEIIIKPNMEEKVGLLKIHVNMFPEQVLLFKGYKGLIVEGTGLGHMPIHAPNEACEIHKDIFKALKDVIESGCVVVMTTNCIFGRVNMNVYSKGTDQIDAGMLSGEDMLAETALVKLSWLLGNYNSADAKQMIGENLRGEINKCISSAEFVKD